MKASLIIPIKDRPEYLEKCFQSLRACNLEDCSIILINDCSKDRRTIALFESFFVERVPIVKITNDENLKVYGSIYRGLKIAKSFEPKYFINLDSDAIVKPNFIERLIETKERFPNNIITGFNCRTRNRDGSERHQIISEGDGYNIKKSVGGINFCFSKKQVYIVESVLEDCINNGGNWDHKLSIKSGGEMVCVVPSIVQHIGFRSSMGHNHEAPDVAEDFDEIKKIALPNVTLFILDTKNTLGAKHAIEQSCKGINFGEVVFLGKDDVEVNSKEEYSNFMVRDLFHYIKTDFVLVIQSDGFVLNPDAWTNDFFKYDYIGAPWWYNDNKNVGNGGFSLRSRRLLEILESDSTITQTHPEDDIICRKYGEYLKTKGIKFAPVSLAEKFSIEGHGSKDKEYKGQFGFHGFGVTFRKRPDLAKIVPTKKGSVPIGARPRAYGRAIK